MTAVTFPDRVARRMTEARPGRAVLTVLAFPFYLLGLVAGLVVTIVMLAFGAVAEGFDSGRGGDRR